LKIVHVISTLNIGGAENFCTQLANQQARENQVEIILLNPTSKSNSFTNNVLSSVQLSQFNWSKKYSVKQLVDLIKYLKLIKPSIVHVHLHNPFYYVYLSSFFFSKIRFIHTVHSNFEVWQPIFRILNFIRFANNKIQHVCIAHSIYTKFIANYPKLKFIQINNGIIPHQIKRRVDEVDLLWKNFNIINGPKFLAIGNITFYKNFSLLAKTLKSLKALQPNINCILIGHRISDDEYKKVIEAGADNLYLAGSIENAADYLHAADALIISSTQEGMPIVALEALSLGVPLLSSPAGGMIDIVDNGYNGFLAKDFSVQSLEECILQWINLTGEQKREMKLAAVDSFNKNYNIGIVYQNYQLLYENKLGK